MRCYFMFDGRIHAVEALENLSGDDDAVRRAVDLFHARVYDDRQLVDGFEVWDRNRLVYRFPKGAGQPKAPPGDVE